MRLRIKDQWYFFVGISCQSFRKYLIFNEIRPVLLLKNREDNTLKVVELSEIDQIE